MISFDVLEGSIWTWHSLVLLSPPTTPKSYASCLVLNTRVCLRNLRDPAIYLFKGFIFSISLFKVGSKLDFYFWREIFVNDFSSVHTWAWFHLRGDGGLLGACCPQLLLQAKGCWDRQQEADQGARGRRKEEGSGWGTDSLCSTDHPATLFIHFQCTLPLLRS